MQFVSNGPDVPERLIQAHEDGRVVFFCGAGVSFPARLPSFKRLVDRIYQGVSELREPPEKAAIKHGQFDTAIALLEQRLRDGRRLVRQEVARILTPSKVGEKELATHRALLTLSQTRVGAYRLVTTNFDHLFKRAAEADGRSINSTAAPYLPVPKARWNSLVYLHGLLPEATESDAFDTLVLSSGDFGRAYLTERWAARFVSELFHSYIVCFVGYSINDPVLRYMVDALAADKLLGESPLEVFAFGQNSRGRYAEEEIEWRSKNVTPILYKAHHNHYYLHKTLRVWAATYRDGVLGKEHIVATNARASPRATRTRDEFVGRVLWALSDKSGLPAKRFAELRPPPSLDWLEVLSEADLVAKDLPRFGLHPQESTDNPVKFSVLRRPAPQRLAAPMALVNWSHAGFPRLDPVMGYLARWLCKHIDDPTLILWVADQGGVIHPEFHREITAEIERRTDKGPAIAPAMHTLWNLALAGSLRAGASTPWILSWFDLLKAGGLTPSLRLMLRTILSPKVVLRRRLFDPEEVGHRATRESSVRDIVDWEIMFSEPDMRSWMHHHTRSAAWNAALPTFLEDFTTLLRDALDLKRELDDADDWHDGTHFHQPSISNHPQNKGFHDWTLLIELTRDAWLTVASSNPAVARKETYRWLQTPYPTFKRLAFFAFTHEGIFTPAEAMNALLADNGWWLWSTELSREVHRLIAAVAPRLDTGERAAFEVAVLKGPPSEMFRDDLEEEKFQSISEREVWLRLEKHVRSGGTLGDAASNRLEEITERNPEWRLFDDAREEFHFWIEDVTSWSASVATPSDLDDLIAFLRQNPEADIWSDDDWEDRCRRDFDTALNALIQLYEEGEWVPGRWRTALQAWSDSELIERAWLQVAELVRKAPDEFISAVAHALGWWLERAAKGLEADPPHFFEISTRLVRQFQDGAEESGNDRIGTAINHPVGHATEAVLRRWYRREPKDEEGLPDDIKQFFTLVSAFGECPLPHGRLLLAAHLVSLFRVDRAWTEEHVLPLLSWDTDSIEAAAAWQGFLWAPRHFRSLMEAIRPEFLETAAHWGDLGDLGEQYAALLTFEAMQQDRTLSNSELTAATRSLPPDGLGDVAETLARTLESITDGKADYWRNRLAPYFRSIWPKSEALLTTTIFANLARLCLAAGEAFPEALAILAPYLQPVPHPFLLLRTLRDAGHCSTHPIPAFEFLHRIVDSAGVGIQDDLDRCLTAIQDAEPSVGTNPKFIQLLEYSRR